MSMPKIEVATIAKVVGLCFAVGLVLSFLNLTPKELLLSVFDNLDVLFRWSVDMFGSIFSYVLIGAVIVLPIWFALYMLKWMKGESK